MAIVYSYPVVTPLNSDNALGSRLFDENGNKLPKPQTVNFSIASISNKVINDFLKNITWRFVIQPDEFMDRPNGTLSFDNYSYGIPFADMTTVKVSEFTYGNKTALEYLQTLVGQNISINNPRDLNNFGVFTLTSFTEDVTEPGFYNMDITFKAGNGSLTATELYYIEASAIGVVSDKFYQHTQAAASLTWVVEHNLNKYPSVTVTLSTGQVGYGDVTYIDENNLTITFSGANSGKAYMN